MATGDLCNKFCEDHSSSSRDMLMERQTYKLIAMTPLSYRNGVITIKIKTDTSPI